MKGNPYLPLLYAHLFASGIDVLDYSKRDLVRGVDIWHLHWPENAANRGSWLVALRDSLELLCLCWITRMRGGRIVWTLHNLHSHEHPHPRLERWHMRMFVRVVSATISPSAHGARLLANRYPRLLKVPCAIIPLGHFVDHYKNACSRMEARRVYALPADALVLGFIGVIRQYKNVPMLIRVFRQWSAPNARLLVAGKPENSGLAEEIRIAAAGDDRIHLELGHLDDERMQFFLNSLDALVLPYEDILNSSSALLGLSFGIPVVAPRLGSLEELRNDVGEDWIRLYDGPLTVGVLSSIARHTPPASLKSPSLNNYDWHAIASATARLYRRAISAPD